MHLYNTSASSNKLWSRCNPPSLSRVSAVSRCFSPSDFSLTRSALFSSAFASSWPCRALDYDITG